MKLFRYTYMILLAVLTVVMAACSSDDDAATSTTVSEQPQGKVPVRLHLSVAGQDDMSLANTRAWEDPYATSDEMMNVWTVIAVHAEDDTNDPKAFLEGDIAFIHASVPEAAKREIDDLVYLQPGRYMFYSFANMEPGYVTSNILCINDTRNTFTPIESDGNLGTPIPYSSDFFYDSTHNDVYLLTWGPECKINLHEYYGNYDLGVAGKTVSVNGNGFDPTIFDPDPTNYVHNGFGYKGIPMSNVQEIEVTGNDDVDLIVIRMMAKIELQITNSTGKAITVNSVTLSDIIQNSENTSNDNLKLLPKLTSGANTMEAIHMDIEPNLDEDAEQGDYVHIINNTIDDGETEIVTFYVNESKTPTNPDGLFYLTLKLNGGTELRYSLISNNSQNEWNYIARNDYRIIPIVIDDYKLELIPYDFPPIGVYPASVKEIEDNLYEMTFHDYGHFHLVPKVTKISTGATVPFGSPTGSDTHYWTLNTDFAGSWYTAATKGGAWLTAEQITSNGFYRNQTVTADGDEVGGVPVWYANDGTAGPQWDPAGGTNYNPFIFGYIADPDGVMSDDKKIYHEFRVQLNGAGASNRVLRYRFYMTLSKDQMLGSRSLTPMSRKRH